MNRKKHKKDYRKILITSFIIIVSFILILTFYKDIQQTIYNPSNDDVLNSITNSYYFPITSLLTNSDICTNKNIILGTNFNPNSSILPSTSTSCMAYNFNNYYKSLSGSSKTGECWNLGTPYRLNDGEINPFKNFEMIIKGNDIIICKQNSYDGYTYTTFTLTTTKICKIPLSYTIMSTGEDEGKYTCYNNNIYSVPCGKQTKKLIQMCDLGCEYTNIKIEGDASVAIAKCKGDYKINKLSCSADGKFLFKTSSLGNLTTEKCCSCSNGVCNKNGCTLNPIAYCKLVAGSGTNKINVITYNDELVPDWGVWIYTQLNLWSPYNEFSYNIYREYPKDYCNKVIKIKSNDIRLGLENISPYWGIGYPGQTNVAGLIKINPLIGKTKYNNLLMHELGHVYTRRGHTTDDSIMDIDMGNHIFYKYQIDLMRSNLNKTI